MDSKFLSWARVASVMMIGAWASGALAADPQKGWLPEGKFLTTGGQSANLNALAGDKIAVINLMYTKCEGEACGKGMENLVALQKLLEKEGMLGKKVVMISITVDPENDTPAKLKKYAESYGVKEGWTFLTGNAEDVKKLRSQLEPPPLARDKKEREAYEKQKHNGMLQIINGATGKRTSISVLDKPERILNLIGRVESRSQKP
jgi:protein SCO1